MPLTKGKRKAAVDLIGRHLARGQTDPDRLGYTVLENLWPATPDGTPIAWDALPSDASPCLIELKRFVWALVSLVIAEANLNAQLQRYHASSLAMGRVRG